MAISKKKQTAVASPPKVSPEVHTVDISKQEVQPEQTEEITITAEDVSSDRSIDAPTVYIPEHLVQIAERFNMVRMIDVGMATDTSETIAFRSFLGEHQVRGGDALVLPTRAPDVETTYGRWWIEDGGVIVGHPVGVYNLLYYLPDTGVLSRT